MPSPVPISENLRQSFRTVIAAVITLAADGGEKPLQVESVHRYGNSSTDLSAVVEQGVDRWLGAAEAEAATDEDNYEQELLVFVSIQEPQDSPDFDLRINRIVADVRKGVMTAFDAGQISQADWVQPRGMGGGMEGARLFENEAGEVAGVCVPFTARYRTVLDDPYNQ